MGRPVVPGVNYRKHAEESGARVPEQPILSMKLPSAVQDPGGDIVLRRRLLRSDQEASTGRRSA